MILRSNFDIYSVSLIYNRKKNMKLNLHKIIYLQFLVRTVVVDFKQYTIYT